MKNHFEPLGGGMIIEVSANHNFGEDALLLAQFTAPRTNDSVCDLGTGCGILPLLWCRNNPTLTINAIEIQPKAAEMAQCSFDKCGVSKTVHVHCTDLREWQTALQPSSHDVVTMNPPYYTSASGEVNRSQEARIARHEGFGCSFNEVSKAAYGIIKPGGRFCFCHKPERLCDIMFILRNTGLEPKKLRFVQLSAFSIPWLFLCEARKGGRPGLSIQPPFLKTNTDGSLSEEQTQLYSMYTNI